MVTIDLGVVHQPKDGNDVNGDSYGVFDIDGSIVAVIADGLGSGSAAQKASLMAVELVRQYLKLQPVTMIELLNKELRFTRGVSLALAKIDLKSLSLVYASVGNVRGLILGKQRNHLISTPGIVGYKSSRSIKQTVYQLYPETALALYSDGLTITNISKQGSLQSYRSAQDLAELMVNLSKKKDDDMTIIVLAFRQKEG